MVVSPFSWLLVNQFLMDADVVIDSQLDQASPTPVNDAYHAVPYYHFNSVGIEIRYYYTSLQPTRPGPGYRIIL